MKKKNLKTKPNQIQIEKQIDTDLKRRKEYVIPSEKSVEFISPQAGQGTRRLFHQGILMNVIDGKYSPEGKLGPVKHFFIPGEVNSKLQTLFNEFDIPESTHNDLKWTFLNMVFASSQAKYEIYFNSEFQHNQNDLKKAVDFLESLLNGNVSLHRVIFDYEQNNKDRHKSQRLTFGNAGKKKFVNDMAVLLIESTLKNHKQSKGFEMLKPIYDFFISPDKLEPFMRHKNAEKKFQSDYSGELFDYLRRQLFSGAFALLDKPEKYQEEVLRLKTLYPRNRIYLFIGRLMELSGLMKNKDNQLEEDIIKKVEKKIAPKIRSE